MMLFEKTKAWEKEINSSDKVRYCVSVVQLDELGYTTNLPYSLLACTTLQCKLKIATLEASLLAMSSARDSLHSKVQTHRRTHCWLNDLHRQEILNTVLGVIL